MNPKDRSSRLSTGLPDGRRHGWRPPGGVAIACLLLYAGLLASRAFILDEPIDYLRSPWNHGYLLLVSCSMIGLTAMIRARQGLSRFALLVVVFAILIVVNSADLSVTNYFGQPLIAIYAYLPATKIGITSIGSYFRIFDQYVPIGFLGTTAIFCLPAFWLLYVIGPGGWRPTILSLTAIAVIGFGVIGVDRWGSPAGHRSQAEARIMAIDPNIPRSDIGAADRSGSIVLSDEVRYAPRTIVLIVNESVSYFFPSSRGEGSSLIDRLISVSGSGTGWRIYRNAVTNSSATDVSLPSLMTGSGSHESAAKIRQMPLLFDIAKARGYETAFFTSAIKGWAQLGAFFASSRIDHMLTASDTDQPIINGQAIDDIYIAKRLASYIRTRGNQQLFVVVKINALHVPYQVTSEIEIPSALTKRRDKALYILESAHKILFDALRKAGRYDDALIVITADHGAASNPDPRGFAIPRLEDYGEETLRIPFLIKLPAGLPAEMSSVSKSNRDRLVANLDIAPTIADLLGVGLKAPLEYQGHSLVAEVPDNRLAVAVSINEWRPWPRTSIALARRRERFVCWSDRLCAFSLVESLEDRKTTPSPDRAAYAAYLKEALSLPIVAQGISKIYHDHYRKTSGPGVDRKWVIPREALRSSLGSPLPTESDRYLLQAKAGHAPGHIIYGPYWELPVGEFRASLSLEIGDGAAKDEAVCALDVYNGDKIVVRRELLADDDDASHRIELPFSVTEDDAGRTYEIRLWCGGRVTVAVKEVAFIRQETSPFWSFLDWLKP